MFHVVIDEYNFNKHLISSTKDLARRELPKELLNQVTAHFFVFFYVWIERNKAFVISLSILLKRNNFKMLKKITQV